MNTNQANGLKAALSYVGTSSTLVALALGWSLEHAGVVTFTGGVPIALALAGLLMLWRPVI